MAVKYKEIAQLLEESILHDKYKNCSKLPTEEELMREFSVSRNTIRKSISLLVDRGYVYQVQGSGIFIRQTSKEGCITLGNIRGLTGDFQSKDITTKLLDLKQVKANEDLAKKILSEDEVQINIFLGDGSGKGTAWGCDLTYEYVKINGDYRT